MIALIAARAAGLRLLREAQAFVARNPGAVQATDASAVIWHPPVRRPSKILGIEMHNSASDSRKISALEQRSSGRHSS